MESHKIAVFAGSRPGEEHEYQQLAFELGAALARSNYTLVNGGGLGLMEECARGAINHAGKVIAVQFDAEEHSQSNYFNKVESFEWLRPRQERIITLAEAFIALPGGIGTCYEAWEILALKQARIMAAEVPLIFLGSYWDSQIFFLDNLYPSGFAQETVSQFYSFNLQAVEAIKELDMYFQKT